MLQVEYCVLHKFRKRQNIFVLNTFFCGGFDLT